MKTAAQLCVVELTCCCVLCTCVGEQLASLHMSYRAGAVMATSS